MSIENPDKNENNEEYDYNFEEEVGEIMKEKEKGIERENGLRNTLWVFDDLEQDGLIDNMTTLSQLMSIIENREIELNQIVKAAEAGNDSEDPVSAEFLEMAKSKSEQARRLLSYYSGARPELERIIKLNVNMSVLPSAGMIKEQVESRLKFFDNLISKKEKEARENKQ